MRLIGTVFVGLLAVSVFVPGKSAEALVVNAQLDQVNNGNVITQPSQIIDVSADDSLGPAWRVTVGGGLNFGPCRRMAEPTQKPACRARLAFPTAIRPLPV